ncbi:MULTISPECIES: hypothetical protein [unclassified Pseudovibrio]|uniref:hypothetical protein n=1 Tax=unclassified Pseudovibrio TaxID=2627060 RepID=UPI0007AE4189|nr:MULTISPECIES: hypothetical protein [unclassified Pseudovibrio]KZL03787.1 hypothetical protein PsW74_00359 [Pseudovibrio sp. W74]KZL09500.1 hypothetical protein PsAD14_01867 [Pseudovibrio sp. Ad14]
MAQKTKIGRRVGGWLYLHRSGVELLPAEDAERLAQVAAQHSDTAWNLCKISKDKISLLHYEDFETSGFPALLHSITFDLATQTSKAIDYSKRENPPILHRKELLLPDDAPNIPMYAALTKAAEEAGLFAKPAGIGTRKAWNKRIADAGLKLDGHQLLTSR